MIDLLGSYYAGFEAAQGRDASLTTQNQSSFAQFFEYFFSARCAAYSREMQRLGLLNDFLEGFEAIRVVARRASLGNCQTFEQFVAGFELASQRSTADLRFAASELHDQFEKLYFGYDEAYQSYMQSQRFKADRFDVLDTLGRTYDEMTHSRMLAWLLDSHYRHFGTHAQGNDGFRLFLQEVALPIKFAVHPYTVRREVPGDESRIDVEIAARGLFLIHIEVKILAREGTGETERESRDLKLRSLALGVPASAVFAFYLTADGGLAGHEQFRSLRWQQIAHVLDQFSDKSEPQDVKLFAAHYARTLRRYVIKRSN